MEQLKHECGVAMIRLLKPLEYYQEKYGTWMYGLNKLYLLMEKQHNRGQEGAGLACVKLEANPGEEYMFRERALGSGAITEIFGTVQSHFKDLTQGTAARCGLCQAVCCPLPERSIWDTCVIRLPEKSGISYVHPFLRRNNWRAKNLALCGNFNMTNVDEIFARHYRRSASIRANMPIPISCWSRWDIVSTAKWSASISIAEAEGLAGMDITHAIEDRIDLDQRTAHFEQGMGWGIRDLRTDR